MIGSTISHYKILEKLGEGGMGVVYKARDTKLNRTVALKFLSLPAPGSKKEGSRLILEAQAAASLNHPNIATIFEFNEVEDPTTHTTKAFIAMEYVEGQTLRELLLEGPLPIQRTVAIGFQLAEALSTAHQHGIVHRDLKPANIIVTPGGAIKILDFGIAKLIGEETATTTRRIAGSAAYMSPEQVRGDTIDHRSDLFSLGVVLFEMVTGKRPFQADHEAALFYSIANTDPSPPTALRPDLPKALEKVILGLLGKDPSRRPQAASAVLAELERISSELNLRLSPPHRQPLAGRVPRWLAAGAVAGLALVILFKILESPDTMVSPGSLVAVIEFENNTGDAELNWMTRGIADMVITDLSQSKYLNVVPMGRISDLLQSGGKAAEVTQAVKFDAARRASASILVTGSIMKAGNALRILIMVYDIRSDRPLSTDHVEREGLEHFFEMVDEITGKIRLVLEIEATGSGEKEQIVHARTRSVEAYKEFTMASGFIEKQYYQDAILHLQKAVELDSSFARAHNSLAHVYDVLREPKLAEASIQKAIRFSKGLPEIDRTMIALQYAEIRGDWDEEFELVKQLALLQPLDPSWHFRLGWYYFAHQRNYEQSVYEYSKALEIDSARYPLYYHYLGHAYLNWGKEHEAIKAFLRHTTLRPEDALAQEALGVAYRLIGKYEEARHQFELALKLKPNFSSALMNLGLVAKEEGRNAAAERFFRDYIARAVGTSDRLEGYYHLARLHLELSRLGQSRAEIGACLALDSTFQLGLWVLGLGFLRAGNMDSASAVLGKIEAITRQSQTNYQREFFHHLRGSFLLEKKDYTNAIEEFQKAVTLGPMDQGFFRNALAGAYDRASRDGGADKQADERRFDYSRRAQEGYGKAIEINPHYAPAHFSLAAMYERMGNKEKAAYHCNRVLAIRQNADQNDWLRAKAEELLNKLVNKR